MLTIDIQSDELLQENLNKLISGMLPHENMEDALFGDVLASIVEVIKVDEFYGEYFVLINTFEKLREIKHTITSYKPRLTLGVLKSVLEANVADLVRNPKVKMSKLLEEEGLEINIEIESAFNNACALLYARVEELYTTCWELKMTTSEAISFIPAYRSSFVTHVAEQSLRTQVQILNSSIKVGRDMLTGSNDWLNYISKVYNEINERVREENEKVFHLDSTEKSDILMSRLAASNQSLANYDLPPMDDLTPMVRHKFSIICANENTGKTQLATNWISNLLIAGRRVVFMTGETSYDKSYSLLLSNYIYKKYNMHVNSRDLDDVEQLPPDIQRLVNIAGAELSGSKLLTMVKYFDYNTVYNELSDMYENSPFDAVVIDHTYALRGSGTEYEKLGNLSRGLRDFKNDYPVYILALSHLSTDAKDQVKRGDFVTVSPTKGSSSLSAEADEILILTDTELLRKQNLLRIQNYKRRGAARVQEYMIIMKKFDVASFFYDDKLQNSGSVEEQQLENLEEIYNSDEAYEENEDYIDLDDDDDDDFI